MATVADVIAECRNDYLLSGAREMRNKLAAGYDASTTSLSFTYDLRGIDSGAKVSVDLEDMYVWEVNTGSKSAVVSRGEFGSTAATHSSGATAYVNARYTNAQIVRAVNNELRSLSSPANGLFRMRSVDVTYSAGLDSYDLTGVTDVLSVYDVRFQDAGEEAEWPRIPASLYEYQRDLDTTVFASGHAIFIRDTPMTGNPVRVWYRAPFSSVSAVTDNITTVTGLPDTAADILALGAAIKLTAGGEIRRNQLEAQPDTRRAQEVPAGARLGANRDLKVQHQMRIAEEAARLAAMYPQRW